MLTSYKPRIAAGACAILMAFGIKAFYSRAGADQLLWILTPSAWLARVVGGIDLVYERGSGFISHAHHLVVGASCAGINFLVIAFLTLYFAFARHSASRFRWLLSSAFVSLCAAIAANGLRIFVSAHLWTADIYGVWLTPARMHRLAGTVIYYASLLALYLAVEAWLGVYQLRARRVTPLLWYLGISLGVPLVGRVVAGGESGFMEHAVWVSVIAVLLTAAMLVVRQSPLLDRRGGRDTKKKIAKLPLMERTGWWIKVVMFLPTLPGNRVCFRR